MKIGTMIDAGTAFKAGLKKHGFQVIEIDPEQFSEQERVVIVREGGLSWCPDEHDKKTDFYIRTTYHDWPELTVDRVKEYANKLIEKDKAKESKRLEEIAEFMNCSDEEIIEKYLSREGELVSYRVSSSSIDSIKSSKDAKERAERIGKIVREQSAKKKKDEEEKVKLRQAEQEKIREENKKKQAILDESLRQWSLDHGSELLKERIAGGYEWEGLAVKEYGDSVFDFISMEVAVSPFEEYSCEVEDRTTPTLKEIQTLKEVKSILPDNAKAELIWAKYEEGETEDYYDEPLGVEKRCELRVTVTCPNGEKCERDFLIK